MQRFFDNFLGVVLVLAGLVSLPYTFMALHEVNDALRGQLSPGIGKWDPYFGVGLFGAISFSAFFMAFRLLRRASLAKPKTTD